MSGKALENELNASGFLDNAEHTGGEQRYDNQVPHAVDAASGRCGKVNRCHAVA